MKKICKILSVLVPSLYLSSATASVTVIDFDKSGIEHGTVVSEQYADKGVHISSVVYNNRWDSDNNVWINGPDIENKQVAFETTGEYGNHDNDLEFNNPSNDYRPESPDFTRTGDNATNYDPLYNYTALEIDGHNFGSNPGNVLILQNADDQDGCASGTCTKPNDEHGNPAGYFEFTFDFLVNIISLDTFDFEEESLLTAQFFDGNNNEIPTGYVFSAMVDGGFKRQDINISGVQRLILNLPGSGAIDNLVYKEVPAPATIGLFGLALLFMARRVRK